MIDERDGKRILGLEVLSDEALVELGLWAFVHFRCDRSSANVVANSVLEEATRRGWPGGWYEDPSIVLEAGK